MHMCLFVCTNNLQACLVPAYTKIFSHTNSINVSLEENVENFAWTMETAVLFHTD